MSQKEVIQKYKVNLEELYSSYNKAVGREQAASEMSRNVQDLGSEVLRYKAEISDLEYRKQELETQFKLEITSKSNSHSSLTYQLQEKTYQLNELKRRNNDLFELKKDLEVQLRDL